MKAHELLKNPDNWTQGWFHKEKKSEAPLYLEQVEEPLACSHCLLGALKICYPDEIMNVEVKNKLRQEVGIPLVDWNDEDERTHEEVYQVLKKLDI
jgi:hypothetical protein